MIRGPMRKGALEKNGPMTEKGIQNRNSDASLGTIFRFRADIFVETLDIFFSSTTKGSIKIEKTIGACTESR